MQLVRNQKNEPIISESIQIYYKSMNQIQLFNGQQKQTISVQNSVQAPKSPSKIESNRPANLSVSKIFSDNQKWRECKIIGKNISIRSYSACCAFQGQLYVYGGYQILNGSLGDFYSIDLSDNQPKFNWVEIKGKNGVTPGSRSKHALVGGKQKIYLIGGLYQDVRSSNDIYEFDPKTQNWTKLTPEGLQNVPRIDSFECVLLQKEGQQTIYIIGGYNDEKAEMSNAIYEFIPSKNKVSVVFENNPTKQNVMKPSCGLACTTDGKNIYIFGGKNEDARNNDLWLFNLKTLEYQLLPAAGNIPAVRSGHTMTYFNDRLYVFGGIYDITWQLDDLHIYNLVKKSWTTLEQDSPRKIQRKNSPEENKGDKSAQKKDKKKKSWYETVGVGLGVNNKSSSSPLNNISSKQKGFSTVYHNEETGSPGKMIDEQRKKVFYQKKAEMLKNFEVDDKQKERYILLETTSQAMKNSLDVIGNPSGKPNPDKLTEFGKETHSKFLAPLQNNSNLVIGKKPCARDGHCSVMLNDELIIFGGDRHQMSFNDIHKLNFNLAQKQIEKGHHH